MLLNGFFQGKHYLAPAVSPSVSRFTCLGSFDEPIFGKFLSLSYRHHHHITFHHLSTYTVCICNMTFSLNCYVYGDSRFDQTITVDLKERDNVFKLKEAIRSTLSPRFDNIPATELNLWQVDFSPEDDVTKWVPNIQQRLNAMKVVFNLFGKGSDIREDHIHIIVNREGMSC
jgi:hypothetical protein